MTKKSSPTYSPEFRPEATQLVVDQNHSVTDAAKVMGASKSGKKVGATAEASLLKPLL